MKLTKIIVPTDFSESSFTAFQYAADLARKWDAEIHLLYIVEKLPQILSTVNYDKAKDNFINSVEDSARKKLKDLVSKFEDEISSPIKPVMRNGINYEEIINYADEIKSELIVIATHGRSGILYTLLGSVAEKVIQLAKCPVLVVKPVDEEES